MNLRDFSQPDPKTLKSLATQTAKDLNSLLANAERISADWLVNAIREEQARRLSPENMNAVIFIEHLEKIATERRTCPYGELSSLLGVEWNKARRKIFRTLGEVLDVIHNEGKPLLTAIVVDAETNRCGKGFFDKARELGFEIENEPEFERDQRSLVFDFWTKK